jgi:hypothetical protein
MGGACSTNGEKRSANRLLVGKAEGRTWVDKVKAELGEIGRSGVDWIGLVQDRDRWRALVNSVLNLRLPQNVGKLSSGCLTVGLSSSPLFDRVGWLVG